MHAQCTCTWSSISLVEAWAVASALEVLGHHFLAHPNGPGLRVMRVVASEESDDYAVSVLAWAQVLKEHVSARGACGGTVNPGATLFAWDPVAEAERTIRESRVLQDVEGRADRFCELLDDLEASHPADRSVLNEIGRLHGDCLADAEDRVLHIAAEVLRDARQWSLFARIYQATLAGSLYEPGDETDFYYRRQVGSSMRAAKRAEQWQSAEGAIERRAA